MQSDKPQFNHRFASFLGTTLAAGCIGFFCWFGLFMFGLPLPLWAVGLFAVACAIHSFIYPDNVLKWFEAAWIGFTEFFFRN